MPAKPVSTAIRAVTSDIDNHTTVLGQLKEATEIGQRIRGTETDSFIRVSDLVAALIINYDSVNGVSAPDAIVGKKFGAPPVLPSFTVATLPDAGAAGAGAMAMAIDATLTMITGLGLAPTGGGANKVPVFSDGTGWKIL